MSSAQDPFYIVKEEVQGSIDKLQSNFHRWERIPSDSAERGQLTKELLSNCESIEWQVDELDKTITVAAKDPALYGTDELELEKRRRWTSTARTQVGAVKKAVVVGKELSFSGNTSANGMRRELLRFPDSRQTDRSNHYSDNDDFIESESDRQLLIMKMRSWIYLAKVWRELEALDSLYTTSSVCRIESLMVLAQRWIVHPIALTLFRRKWRWS